MQAEIEKKSAESQSSDSYSARGGSERSKITEAAVDSWSASAQHGGIKAERSIQPATEGDARARAAAIASLPELTLTDAEKQSLPQHYAQTDMGLGTQAHPVNNNCQTSTLKDVFAFYHMDNKAGSVNSWEEQLLKDVHDLHGRGIDFKALSEAFKGDAISPADMKEIIRHGQTDGVFQAKVKIPELKTEGVATTPELANLFLSEMGCRPEQVDLGTTAAAGKVTDALKQGKPVLIGDNDTQTLLQDVMTKAGLPHRPPVQGHVYMVYQKEGNYYVSDPGFTNPVRVPADLLLKKLMDSKSHATIVNQPPDSEKFLRH